MKLRNLKRRTPKKLLRSAELADDELQVGLQPVKIKHKRNSNFRSVNKNLEALPPKPLPIGQPRVWAEKRWDLCAGLPYFRSPEAGIYYKHGVAFGYLLDRFPSKRDFVGSHVVISHGCPIYANLT